MSKGWDNIMLKKLKALTGKGLSTSEIGKRLGMSKNAIVGKLNRLGWNSKAGGAPVADKAVATKEKKSTTKEAVKKDKSKKSAEVKKISSVSLKNKAIKKQNKDSVESKSKKSGAKSLAMHQRIIQHSLEMANLKPNQCRWPIGDPDSENFHFCGELVFVGKPYCYEHCKQAYQFTPPKKKQ